MALPRAARHVRALCALGAFFALGTSLGLGGVGCSRVDGKRYQCTCGFLTDYDNLSKHTFELCAAEQHSLEAQARSCAQSASPGPVQSCACTAVPAASSCPAGECRSKE